LTGAWVMHWKQTEKADRRRWSSVTATNFKADRCGEYTASRRKL